MTYEEYIYKKLRLSGATKEGACAVLANLQAESGIRANNLQDTYNQTLGMSDEEFVRRVDSGNTALFMTKDLGFGVAQWTYWRRKEKYLAFFRSKGVSIADEIVQVEFMIKEFKEDFSTCWNMVCGGGDLYGCTDKLLEVWENPREKEYSNRQNIASNKYGKVDRMEAIPDSYVKEYEVHSKVATENSIEKVLNLARSEVGYHEKASNSGLDDKNANSGTGNWTKYARDLDRLGNFYNSAKNGYMWCDVFVDWLFVKCFGAEIGRQMLCQPLNSAGAGCKFSVQYYKQYNRWFSNPEPGDQIFFTYAPGEYSHTGIVEAVSGGVVTTIEGNTTEQVGRRTYTVGSSNIAGYGRPRWELAGGSDPTLVLVSERILKLGCRGDDVEQLQKDLIKLGYDVGPDGADGDFGDNTKKAVMAFQRDNGLNPVDGEVGDDTRRELKKVLEIPQGKEEKQEEPVKKEFKYGDIVNFNGKRQYVMPDYDFESSCHPGKARITGVVDGAKHPYHVVCTEGSTSDVYGWVNKEDLS